MTLHETIIAAQTGGSQANADGSTTCEFLFRADDPVFAGHFPGRPILPGVFQPEMAHVAAEKVLGKKLAVREIVRAKFQQPVLPEETVRVDLKLAEQDGLIHARAEFSVNSRAVGETILWLSQND